MKHITHIKTFESTIFTEGKIQKMADTATDNMDAWMTEDHKKDFEDADDQDRYDIVDQDIDTFFEKFFPHDSRFIEANRADIVSQIVSELEEDFELVDPEELAMADEAETSSYKAPKFIVRPAAGDKVYAMVAKEFGATPGPKKKKKKQRTQEVKEDMKNLTAFDSFGVNEEFSSPYKNQKDFEEKLKKFYKLEKDAKLEKKDVKKTTEYHSGDKLIGTWDKEECVGTMEINKTVIGGEIKKQIEETKERLRYSKEFHPQKVSVYEERLKELENELKKSESSGGSMAIKK